VVRRAAGRSTLGCLVALLIVTAAVYFAFPIGEVYWRYYRYQDAMQQEARFAQMRTDQAITRRLVSVAEASGLPDAARQVQIRRDPGTRRIYITAEYSERVGLPGWARTFHFTPRAEGTY
jgi:hypothetical protein